MATSSLDNAGRREAPSASGEASSSSMVAAEERRVDLRPRTAPRQTSKQRSENVDSVIARFLSQ